MMDLGRHAEYVWLCYGIAAFVVVLLIVWLLADGRRNASQLAELEGRGVRRRSASAECPTGADRAS